MNMTDTNEQPHVAFQIYAHNSELRPKDIYNDLLAQPNVKDNGEGDLFYLNEDTNVSFYLKQATTKNSPKGFTHLKLAFLVPLGKPEFFGLEAFPIIEKVCKNHNLLLDIANAGKPKTYTAAQLHKAWLKLNDEQQQKLWREDVNKRLGYMPRKISNDIWRYLLQSSELQQSFKKARNKTIVCKPMSYRNFDTGNVTTVIPWLDYHKVPFIIPPHTDYVFRIRIIKKFGVVPYPTPLGYIQTEKLLKGLEDQVILRDDGSIHVPKETQPLLRERAEQLGVDLPPKYVLGDPMLAGHIVDMQ
jgi:hypothetical protein